jgi:hypothetical protein
MIFAPVTVAMFKRLVLVACAALTTAFSVCAQDYKLEPIDTPPPSLTAAYASLIFQRPGFRVVGPKGSWCEVWFRNSIPVGPKPGDSSISLAMAQGTLIGILRFPAQGADRRGQVIQPGVYTLRYSNYPVDGAHQGVAPQRDFALLTPIADDLDPNALPNFDALVQMSGRASSTPHPAVLSLETPADAKLPSLTKEGDHDWVLNVKVGDLQIAIIVAGKYEG